MNKDEKAQQFWDKQAARYDATDTQFEPAYREIFSRTRTFLDPDDHVLDFGCATGSKTVELAGMVKHVHGLDLSPLMINQAWEKKKEKQVSNITFSHGTIFDKRFEEAYFDKVIAYSVLHLLDDIDAAVQRIHQLLKTGGLFISATPCFRDRMAMSKRLQFSMVFLMKRLGLFPLHLNKFHGEDIARLVEKQGFTVLASETLFHEMSISFLAARK